MKPVINFTVYGNATPQGRARAFLMRNRRIGFYDPDKSKSWKQEIKHAFMKQYENIQIIEDAIELQVTFWMQRPKSLPKKVLHHVKKPDLDNLLKAIKDSLSGLAYRDDSQIVSIRALKVYCTDRPRVLIKITNVTKPSPTTKGD